MSSLPLPLKSAKAAPFCALSNNNGKPATSEPSIFIAYTFAELEKEPNTISKSLSSSKLPKAGVPTRYLLAL